MGCKSPVLRTPVWCSRYRPLGAPKVHNRVLLQPFPPQQQQEEALAEQPVAPVLQFGTVWEGRNVHQGRGWGGWGGMACSLKGRGE